MIRARIVEALINFAHQFGAIADGSEWYLFGSIDRDEPTTSDIDLLILCISDRQADALRQTIDPDSLLLPLHLSLMTYDEANEIGAVQLQFARKIYPIPERGR